MPHRAPQVCGLCGKVHPHGEQCPVAAARTRERNARADARRPTAKRRGYDREWEELRAHHLAAHPNCQRSGCTRRASLVDHIISIRKAPHRRLDPTNLQSLCTPCHSGWKQAQEKRSSL